MDDANLATGVPISRSSELMVADVMTSRVAVVSESQNLAFAAQVLLWRRIRHLPVVSADGRLVGMLSDRDLFRFQFDGPAGSLPVRDAMRARVPTVAPSSSLSAASAILVREEVDALAVVHEGKLVGMVSTTDILAERAKRGDRRGLRAADIMHRDLVVAHPGDSLASVVEKLVRGNFRHLPVVDGDYRVVGVVSDRDVRAAAGDPREAMTRASRDGFLSDVTVDTLMSRKPVTIAASLGVLEIGDLLLRENIGAVPVVADDDTLVGIVSYVDVLSHLIGYRG